MEKAYYLNEKGVFVEIPLTAKELSNLCRVAQERLGEGSILIAIHYDKKECYPKPLQDIMMAFADKKITRGEAEEQLRKLSDSLPA